MFRCRYPLLMLCLLSSPASPVFAQGPLRNQAPARSEFAPLPPTAEAEARSMSPPEWGGDFIPLPTTNSANDQAQTITAPRGSTRSTSLPGLSIGPEIFPGSSSPQPTQRRPEGALGINHLPVGQSSSGTVVWPSQIEGSRVPAQSASVLRHPTSPAPSSPMVATPVNNTPPLDGPSNSSPNFTAQPFVQQPVSGQPVAHPNQFPQANSTHLPAPSQLPQESPSAYFPPQPAGAGPATAAHPFAPGFDPGFRQDGYSGNSLDWLENGQQFPHEAQQHYPPLSEILKTGRYFGSLEWQLLQPHLQNNTALIRSSPGSFSSQQFNWTYESAPQFRAGFESKYGPGVELDYWQFDHDSSSLTGVSDGITSFTSVLPQGDAGTFNQLSATAAGERLVAQQGLEMHSAGLSFFKEMKLPISRLSGTFGLRYLSIAQQAEALQLNSSGTQTGSLSHITDFRGFGPRIRLDYFRPVGHTKLESIASFGSSLLYGNRDQFVSNSLAGNFTRTNADELVTSVEAAIGVQYVKHLGENRSAFVRLTYQSQTWLGGGTGTDAAGDLGFRGLGVSIGANR